MRFTKHLRLLYKIKHLKMKKQYLSLLFLILSLTTALKAQNAQASQNLKNWIVDLSQAYSSYNGIKIDKVELNDQNTIVHMSFRNMAYYTNHIEACNTFHIRSNGKKVANFVKAENIPTRNVKKTGFTCADIETAMRVRPGQFVRFRLYFTRIPSHLTKIDIIEFDGEQDCEFDVWNLNISRKEPLPNALAVNKTTPSVATAKKAAIPNKKTTSKTQTATQAYPDIASKSPNATAPITDKSTVKSNETIESHAPVIEKREIKVVKDYTTTRKVLQVEIWDNDKEDGDIASIILNDHLIIKNLKVTKAKKKVEIPLSEGANTLVFYAENLGTAPPNTAALTFWDGSTNQTIILNSDMGKSEAIRVIKN